MLEFTWTQCCIVYRFGWLYNDLLCPYHVVQSIFSLAHKPSVFTLFIPPLYPWLFLYWSRDQTQLCEGGVTLGFPNAAPPCDAQGSPKWHTQRCRGEECHAKGIKLRASHMLGMCSTWALSPDPYVFSYCFNYIDRVVSCVNESL